jgi:hypothetical protein
MIRQRRQLWQGFALLATAMASVAADAACPPAESDGTALRKGDLTLAWRPLPAADKAPKAGRIAMAKHFALEVQLCDKYGVSAAQLLKTDATMPAHRHGMNYRPVIKPLGAGRFRVDGMMFHMAGQWELAFEVKSGNEVLRLTQEVQAD